MHTVSPYNFCKISVVGSPIQNSIVYYSTYKMGFWFFFSQTIWSKQKLFLLQKYKTIEKRYYCTYNPKIKPWLWKPNRNEISYISSLILQVPLDEPMVVAKYIDNPLLVNGHKWDLRLYVAVTSYDPLCIYLYEEGLVRFATVRYDSSGKNLWNPCMHLCNYR